MPKKTAPKVDFLPTNMKLKSVSKSEFLEIRRKNTAANAAAEEARRKVLEASGISMEDEKKAGDSKKIGDKVSKLKRQLQSLHQDLKEDPSSTKIQKKIAKAEEELDEAEAELEEAESK